MQVWSKLDDINCPESFKADWNKNIKQIIKGRISEMVSVLVCFESKVRIANIDNDSIIGLILYKQKSLKMLMKLPYN